MIHTEFVSIVKKTQKDILISNPEVLEKINVLMMEFLLDLITKNEKQTYIEIDFNIIINKKSENIKIAREPTPKLQMLVGKIRSQKQSVTGLYTFV